MNIGLALGGGGSKGAYQIGAWQAFRELGIHFDFIVGTSIGSINAAFMACDDYDGAVRMWESLQMEQCLAISEKHALKSNDLLSLRNVNALAREMLTQGGLNTQPLRELLGTYIQENRIRESQIQFGLMTALLPKLTPMPRWIQDIPENRLIDFIMASTRFPGLQKVKIDGRRFIDGGAAENVPISMLRDLGIRRIFAVDLGTNATIRSPILDNIQLTYIHNRMDLGSMFDIDHAILNRNRRLGYLDTLKALDRLAGEYYAFEPIEHQRLCQRFGADNVRGLEQAALAYNIDRGNIYQAKIFLDLIHRNRQEVQREYKEKRQLLQIDHKFSAIMNGRLKALNLLPPMRLAFLLEISSEIQQKKGLLSIPMQHFRNLDRAVQALGKLDGESEEQTDRRE
jgi:NTE family protein